MIQQFLPSWKIKKISVSKIIGRVKCLVFLIVKCGTFRLTFHDFITWRCQLQAVCLDAERVFVIWNDEMLPGEYLDMILEMNGGCPVLIYKLISGAGEGWGVGGFVLKEGSQIKYMINMLIWFNFFCLFLCQIVWLRHI